MLIKNITRTKERFQYYHKRLWNKVIELLKLVSEPYNDFKMMAFKSVFHKSVVIENNCFGCDWARHSGCENCLFNVNTDTYCLNGLWNEFKENPTIKTAIKIRDLPIK